MITQQKLHEIFSYNPLEGFLRWKTPGKKRKHGEKAGYQRKDGYVEVELFGTKYLEHSLIWLFVYGEPPKEGIDHENRVRNDNRQENLLDKSPARNSLNRKIPSNNTSGFRGVSFITRLNKYQASIRVDKKTIFLGCFSKIADAVEARRAAELEYLGSTIK